MDGTQAVGSHWSHGTQAMLMRTPPPGVMEIVDAEDIERDVEMDKDITETTSQSNDTAKFDFAPLVRYVPRPCRKRSQASGVRDFDFFQDKRQRIAYSGQDQGDETFEDPFKATCDINDPDAMDTNPPAYYAESLLAPSAEKETEGEDPRQYFARCQRSKTPGGRSRRMSSIRLPLEMIPVSTGTHDLHMAVQTTVDEVSRAMDSQAKMDFETTYDITAAPDRVEATLNFRSMSDTMDVEHRLREVVDSNMDDVEAVYTIQDRTKGKGKAA